MRLFKLQCSAFGGGTIGINVNQFAPSVAGNVFLLHLPLTLPNNQHGFGGFGSGTEKGDVALPNVDGGFAVVEFVMTAQQ